MLCKFLQTYTGKTQDNQVGRITRWLDNQVADAARRVLASDQPHLALAYCSLATCPRESLRGPACHTGMIQLLKRAPPCRLQPMHTKREMVYTVLPEAMLINSTALTMTRMAPNHTALGGMWTSVSAVQLVLTTGRLKCRTSRFFLSKSGQKFGLQLVHPVQILKMSNGCCKSALAHSPKGDLVP